jgi:nucleotide-binding universal stress UspA family protein
MTPIRRILVPTDFSTGSNEALDLALSFGKSFGASVDVLHAWEVPADLGPEWVVHAPGEPNQTMSEFVHGRASSRMETLLAERRQSDSPPLRGRLQSGDPSEVIVNAAAEGYDLVVMSTHGRTGIERVLLGSVAEKVVRQSPCPVLTLRRRPGNGQRS